MPQLPKWLTTDLQAPRRLRYWLWSLIARYYWFRWLAFLLYWAGMWIASTLAAVFGALFLGATIDVNDRWFRYLAVGAFIFSTSFVICQAWSMYKWCCSLGLL